MTIQSFPYPAPAVGNAALISVSLKPGQFALVAAITGFATVAAANQLSVVWLESGFDPNLAVPSVFGPLVAALGGTQSFTAALGVSTSAPGTGLAFPGHNIALPKLIMTQNFSVKFTSTQLAGADQLGAGRVIVWFGTMDEMLMA